MNTYMKSCVLGVAVSLLASNLYADEPEKFGVVEESKTPLIAMKLFSRGGDGNADKKDLISSGVSRFTVGDKAVICLQAGKAGFAKVWDIKPNGDRDEIAPNSITKELPFVTTGNKSIKLKADQAVCMGTADQGFAFQISKNELGKHRLWVQWSADEKALYSDSDYPSFSKSLGVRDELTAPEMETLERISAQGVVEYRYDVTQ